MCVCVGGRESASLRGEIMEAYRLRSAGIPVSCLKQHQSSLGSQAAIGGKDTVTDKSGVERGELSRYVMETVFQVSILDS